MTGMMMMPFTARGAVHGWMLRFRRTAKPDTDLPEQIPDYQVKRGHWRGLLFV